MTRGQDITLAGNNNIDKKDSVPDAILTITKNVLGPNVTKTIEPLIKRRIGDTPLNIEVQTEATPSLESNINTKKTKKKKRKEQINADIYEPQLESILPTEILAASNNISYNTGLFNETDIQGKEGENRCKTPKGQIGRCEDLSNCPGLLLDLSHLRHSLCFKSLFVPGVCCPLNEIPDEYPTQRPLKLTTAHPIRTTTRQSLILRPTTRRPFVPVHTIESSESHSHTQSQLGSFDNFVDPEECGQTELDSGRIVGGTKSNSGQWPCK